MCLKVFISKKKSTWSVVEKDEGHWKLHLSVMISRSAVDLDHFFEIWL